MGASTRTPTASRRSRFPLLPTGRVRASPPPAQQVSEDQRHDEGGGGQQSGGAAGGERYGGEPGGDGHRAGDERGARAQPVR
ncbi:hypothetical protein [Streptomyces sp. NPDC005989]|uniref:hypothetical protein n=1 Tax=Streptomyces sp. NPDC005989 TaxID=3156727 RepID=UPI003410E6DF